MAPQVTIIIPAYNQARYLGEAIQSALDQKYRSFEVVVVDDGSTDNTPDVIRGFGDRIRSIRQTNMGLGGARNTGILASKAEYVGLLDADDQWLPDYLKKLVRLAEQNSDAGVYYCGAQGIDEQGRKLPQSFGTPVTVPDEVYQILLRNNFLIPSTVLIRRAVLIEKGLFEQTNKLMHGCEDLDLWLRLAPFYQFIGTSECLVNYRLHNRSLSADPSKMQSAQRAVIEKHFGEDDGKIEEWPDEKRRAYGGVYKYSVLTRILRQNDWKRGTKDFQEALLRDPSLSEDLSFFYDLALGNQPIGYRGSNMGIDIFSNEKKILVMLEDIFGDSSDLRLCSLRNKAYGTLYYALGLVSYNIGQRSISKRHLLNALRYRPDLVNKKLLWNDFLKSFVPLGILKMMKSIAP